MDEIFKEMRSIISFFNIARFSGYFGLAQDTLQKFKSGATGSMQSENMFKVIAGLTDIRDRIDKLIHNLKLIMENKGKDND